MNKFMDKVIVITGGASDIGKAITMELSDISCNIVLLDINKDGLKKISEENEKKTVKLATEVVDMTNPTLVEEAFNNIMKKYKRIDYVFNIVGFGMVGEARDMSIDDWQSIINVNLHGMLYPTIFSYKLMVKQRFGNIVNMSSLGGIIPSPFNTGYATTKAAIVGLSTSLREEGKEFGVNVSVVCAGGIKTKLWDSVRLLNLKREEFVKLIPPNTLASPSRAAKIILKNTIKHKRMIIFPAFANISNFVYKHFAILYDFGIKFSVKSLRSIREK